MRKCLWLVTTSLILSLFSTPILPVNAESEPQCKVDVDGKPVSFQNKPFIIDGRMWVPFRETMQALGGKVSWIPERQMFVAIFGQSRSLAFTMLDKAGLLDGLPFETDFLPIIKDDKSYIPVRTITQLLDMRTNWNQQDSTVSIDSSNFHFTVAVESGDINAVDGLLKAGFNVNSSVRGESALNSVAQNGNISMAEFLLENGATCNAEHNISALDYAAENGNLELIKLFLQHGADPNKSAYHSPLVVAARNHKTEAVKQLLAAGADPNLLREKHEASPLYYAIWNGDLAIVKQLLQAKADLTTGAIIEAAAKNDLKMVQALIQAGADPNVADDKSWTALKVAAELGNTDIIDVLLKAGADPNKKGIYRPNALDIALGVGNTKAAKLLQDNGARTTEDSYYLYLHRNIGRSGNSWSPLMLAVGEGNTKKVKELIETGADVNQVAAEYQDTPLSIAITCGNIEIIHVLLSAGANPALVDQRFNSGNIPPQLLDLLMKKGWNLNKPNDVDWYLLHSFAVGNNLEMLRTALQNGANPNVTDALGSTALSIAVSNGNTEAVDMLLQFGASVNPLNGIPPLLESITHSNLELMGKLLTYGANPNDKYKDLSAFEYAVYLGNTQAVQLLLTNGANPNMYFNNQEQSVLQFARDKGYSKIVDMLKKAGGKE